MGVCNGYQMPVLVHNPRDSIYQPRIPKAAGDRIPFDMRADLDEAKRCHRVSASRAIVPGAQPEIARRDPERKSRHGPPSTDISRRIGTVPNLLFFGASACQQRANALLPYE